MWKPRQKDNRFLCVVSVCPSDYELKGMGLNSQQFLRFAHERVSWPGLLITPGIALFLGGLGVLFFPEIRFALLGGLLMVFGVCAVLLAVKGLILFHFVAATLKAHVIFQPATQPETPKTASRFDNQPVH